LVSIVIPVYRDGAALARSLAHMQCDGAEVIVAATPGDRSLDTLRAERTDLVWVEGQRGRAAQMNTGAAAATGHHLLFLHADTRLPVGWAGEVERALADRSVAIGCFRFALDSPSPAARVLEAGVRVRVAVGRLPYGDQALFLRRSTFEALGGYAPVPIMEDVLLVKRARRLGHLYISRLPAVTSARRWEADGWIRRTARHIRLMALFFAGVPPDRLIHRDPGRTSL